MELRAAPKPFAEASIAAFPAAFRNMAIEAVRVLRPLVDDDFRKGTLCVRIDGNSVYIPSRFHFVGIDRNLVLDYLPVAANALVTRSTDGYVRQRALRNIILVQHSWALPFIVISLGDYVVELSADILNSIQMFDRALYREFVQENRSLMRLIRAKAQSYWDKYYRLQYPDRSHFPNLVALREIEQWAS